MTATISLKKYLSWHFAAVAVLPVIIIAGLTWLFMMPDIKTRTGIQHQVMARSIAGEISAYLAGGKRQMMGLAESLSKRKFRDDGALSDLLDVSCGNGAFFETMFLVDSTMQTIQTVGLASTHRARRSDFIGMDISGRGGIYSVGDSRAPVWSKFFLSTVNGRPAVALTIPLADGYFIGEITLDNLSGFISRLPVESEFLILVIDDRGVVVADSRRRYWGLALNKKDICGGPADHNALSAFDLDGVKMLGTAADMEETGWEIVVAQPVTKAYQPLVENFILIGLELFFALALALAAGLYLAGKFTHIFTFYADRAASVAGGAYDLQWPRHKTDEFSLLGQSLEQMAKKISQRETELRESEARIRDILTNIPGVAYQYAVDTKGNVLEGLTTLARERGLEVFGVDFQQGRFNEDFIACIPREDRARLQGSVEEAVRNVKPWHYEGRFIKPTGEEIWFEGASTPRQVNGTTYHYGVLSDITRRKEMESSLRLTQFCFDKAPIGIWRMGRDGEVLEVNEQGCNSLGYSREELCCMSLPDFVPDYSMNALESSVAKQRAADGAIFESRHRRKNGDIFPVQIILKTMTFEDQEYRMAFVQDITERKAAQEKLKQNEEDLRRLRNYLVNIIDSMPSILLAIDRHGRVTLWNQQAQRATGLGLDEVLFHPLDQVFPRLARESESIQRAIRERRVISVQKQACRSENSPRFEDLTIFPLVANGVEGAVVRIDDVTQQVRMEEIMIQSEKMLSVGGLAAGMAHEINNPLAGILQNLSLLENRLIADLPANRKACESLGISMADIRSYADMRSLPHMIGNIRDAGNRAAHIVRNMLSFARQNEKIQSSHDLGELLDQSIELLNTDYDMKKKYDFKQIKITREYDEDVVPVFCDPGKIQQVFINILRNGAEAMAEAGTSPSQQRFTLRIKNDGPWVCVEIQDTGPGMDENMRRRAFEPFFTTKPVGFGTGLGLSISYFIIVTDHQGEMMISNTDGQGTCFVIRLPGSLEAG